MTRFLISMLLCAAATDYASSRSSADAYQLPAPVLAEHHSIRYAVSPQMELIAVVQAISGYAKTYGFLLQNEPSQYSQDVERQFSRYHDDPLVQMFDRLSARPGMMNFSAPSNIMLYADDHLELRSDLVPDQFVLARGGGSDSVRLFFRMLKDFAVRSSFTAFFDQHASYYARIIAATLTRLDSVDHIRELESFYGTRQKSYSIILVPLYGHVGFGNSVVLKSGEREVFDTMGPQRIVDGVPFFGDAQYMKYITRHEFSHPFINPLTDKYWETLKGYASRFDSLPASVRSGICGDWQECVNEFIIRAVTVHLAFLDSQEAGSSAYEREENNGVVYLDDLLASLRVYSSHREQFPTFQSFYPSILDVFKK